MLIMDTTTVSIYEIRGDKSFIEMNGKTLKRF